MVSNTITHSGYAIYYEEHKAYLGPRGIHYDIPCIECMWSDIMPIELAKAVAYCRKAFEGNIYVVRVEIKCQKANTHNEETFDYNRFVKSHNARTQKSIEESLKEIKVRVRNFVLGKYEHKSMLTWIKHCKRYLQETFYNKPKKEVNNDVN